MDEKGYNAIIQELLNMLSEGVYIVDKDGVGLYYNKAMASMEKIEVEDVVGKEYNKAFPGVAIDDSTLFRALKKGKETINFTQTYRNLYGKEITTVNSTMPVKVGGEIIGAVEVARDITGLQSMSETILDLQEKTMESKNGLGKKEESQKPKIKQYSFDDIIGKNPKFLEVVERAKKAAGNSATVFISGETGTGKELFAQSIHRASARKDKPFLAQNCAALPESLLEGILFGTTKGGFTGAVDRAGLFEQASGGTLLLDEVSAMPYELQGKLLRVLQEKYVRRIGGVKDIPIDTRIIATVNEDPDKLIESGRLRKDLYYRLNVVNISIPPLRARPDDIPILAESFMAKYSDEFGKSIWLISEKAREKLLNYDYSGNVRELENIIIQGISMAGDEHILSRRHIQLPMKQREIMSAIEKREKRQPLPEYMESLEKEIIREAVMDAGGNITKAAESLGILRQTLQHKIRKYGI